VPACFFASRQGGKWQKQMLLIYESATQVALPAAQQQRAQERTYVAEDNITPNVRTRLIFRYPARSYRFLRPSSPPDERCARADSAYALAAQMRAMLAAARQKMSPRPARVAATSQRSYCAHSWRRCRPFSLVRVVLSREAQPFFPPRYRPSYSPHRRTVTVEHLMPPPPFFAGLHAVLRARHVA